MAKGIVIGVGDVYLADRNETQGAVTYGTPKAVCTASKISVTYTKGKTVVYESGVAVLNRPYVTDAQVTVDTATLSLEDQMQLYYGLTATAGSDFEEGADTDAPQLKALGYSYKLSDGTYKCIWWYCASAQPADENGETENENGYTPVSDSIVFDCVKDPVKRARRRVKVCATEQEKTAFFAAVVAE